MSRRRSALIIFLCVIAAAIAGWWVRYARNRAISLRGAVITANLDPRKQLPIAGVEVTASDGIVLAKSSSSSTGLFAITLRNRNFRTHPVRLSFRHMDYQPLDLTASTASELYIAEMLPVHPQQVIAESLASQTISTSIVARYSIKTATVVNVGSEVRTFEVQNTGNVPCGERPPCSPDGKWKAAMGSITLDAGAGDQFRNVRASCIAGPCPFTKITPSDLQQAGNTLTVSATVWSDTATFLVEAELAHPMISDLVRNSYPVIFGDALNFTLPPAAEGVSLEAELNGENIVFPLGPDLILSWADCNARTNPDQTRVYRCTLKPGYRWAHVAH